MMGFGFIEHEMSNGANSYVYIYIYVHMYTYVYIYIYTYTCACCCSSSFSLSLRKCVFLTVPSAAGLRWIVNERVPYCSSGLPLLLLRLVGPRAGQLRVPEGKSTARSRGLNMLVRFACSCYMLSVFSCSLLRVQSGTHVPSPWEI